MMKRRLIVGVMITLLCVTTDANDKEAGDHSLLTLREQEG